MNLVSALTDAGGMYNEDAFGFIENDGEVTAAWVIDGVTGINSERILPNVTDARWFVERVQTHLAEIINQDRNLEDVLVTLVNKLVTDWQSATLGLDIPNKYDLPACCLLLVQRTEQGWRALRLGDSFLLLRHITVQKIKAPESNLSDLETSLKAEARRRQKNGVLKFESLLNEFKPQLWSNRQSRNKPGGYSVLEPLRASLAMPQFVELGWPTSILLCTDGFYRCVDHYFMHSDTSLLMACQNQVSTVALMQSLRDLEWGDPACQTYLRLKPTDDATVVTLFMP